MDANTEPHDELIAAFLETGDDTMLASLSDDEAADLRATRALLADASLWDEPSPDLGDRIDAEVRATPQVPAVTTLAAARAARTGAHRPALAGIVGLAAGIAIAFGVVAVNRTGDDDTAGRTVALAATDLAPKLDGTARVAARAAGFEITLDVSGLARAPKGFFYEAWVKGDRGLVPIGTFHTGGHVVLWSGVELADYPLLTVTIEAEDGDPASSGRRLLTATLRG